MTKTYPPLREGLKATVDRTGKVGVLSSWDEHGCCVVRFGEREADFFHITELTLRKVIEKARRKEVQ